MLSIIGGAPFSLNFAVKSGLLGALYPRSFLSTAAPGLPRVAAAASLSGGGHPASATRGR